MITSFYVAFRHLLILSVEAIAYKRVSLLSLKSLAPSLERLIISLSSRQLEIENAYRLFLN